MNREIKFRGFSVTDKVWVYGSLNAYTDKSCLITNLEGTRSWFVHPESVGQFTGLQDNLKVDLYEGDILKQALKATYRFGEIGSVRYEPDYGGFIVEGEWSKHQHHEQLSCDIAFEYKIIGNKYQTPELLA